MSRYRKRHQLPEDHPVKFAAGFAMLRGKVGLAFDAGQGAILPDGLGLAFNGDVDGHDLFDAKRGIRRESGSSRPLQAAVGPRSAGRPAVDRPVARVTSDKRTLMIDLHWNMPEVDGSRAELNRFELIEFLVPHQWGTFRIRRRQARPVRPRRRASQDHPVAPAQASRRRPTTPFRLDDRTSELDPQDGVREAHPGPARLSGPCAPPSTARFPALPDRLLPPRRRPVSHLDVNPRTEISVRFDISLSACGTRSDGPSPITARPPGKMSSGRGPISSPG